jgi:rSAM/selenodomain-associated transferase 1
MPLSPVAVILMAKYPTAGRVKTRLMPDLTADQAAAVHRVFLQHLVRRLDRLAPAELVICFDPPDQADRMRDLLANTAALSFIPQCGGDLGARLASAARDVAARHRRLLFLGVDSPDVPVAHLFKAAELTEQAPVSLSPTTDGGYWSLGLRSNVDAETLLTGIPWSSGNEAMATLQSAESLGLTSATGLAWDDVDYPADLRRLIARLTKSDAAADRELLVTLLRTLPEGWLS